MELLLSPSFVFSVLLASLYGAVFHFVWGKRWRDLGIYWAAAVRLANSTENTKEGDNSNSIATLPPR